MQKKTENEMLRNEIATLEAQLKILDLELKLIKIRLKKLEIQNNMKILKIKIDEKALILLKEMISGLCVKAANGAFETMKKLRRIK